MSSKKNTFLLLLPKGGPAYAFLGVVSCAAIAMWYPHYAQFRDKSVMRAGVERDKERLRLLRLKQQNVPTDKDE